LHACNESEKIFAIVTSLGLEGAGHECEAKTDSQEFTIKRRIINEKTLIQ